MKNFQNSTNPPVTAVLSAALLAALAPLTPAQTVDTSTGQVGDSSTSPSVVPPANPAASSLVAKLAAANAESKIRGEVRFSVAGDALNVSGRIDGLEPNGRYQLAVPVGAADPAKPDAGKPDAGDAAAKPGDPATDADKEGPAAGEPAAGPPEAGLPHAGPPEAGAPDAGKPDGTMRPGAAGAGTQGAVASRTRASNGKELAQEAMASTIGILTADVNGGTNVNLTARGMTLESGPAGIRGRTVTLTLIPTEDPDQKPAVVASGSLEPKGKENP